jgi:ATP-dependent helicase HrpA
VLATNVAETSLTVPGIRYVVDPGTARISRYSARLKVQRLPIEAISQASADQRKGRCGRVADGICIRLYSEEDFDGRPRYTDPEILRTNLASVILQMAAANLGDVEDFPFLDPPDRRQVRDGIRLLQELAALDAGERLTPLGRRLAQLPVDPRLGRMVLEAERLGCAAEVIVIAAALSIQDPRERPAEAPRAGGPARRFADELGLPRVPQPVAHSRAAGARRATSSARRCKASSCIPARARVAGPRRQLRRRARVARAINRSAAEPTSSIARALPGLLSHRRLRDAARREYLGAAARGFALAGLRGRRASQPAG